MEVLGIDIGGSGMKAAPVDTAAGKLTGELYRLETPDPAMPAAVAAALAELVRHFSWKGPIGCGFPGAVRHGVVLGAANLSRAWQDVNAVELFTAAAGRAVAVANDADVAGLAEMRFGAGRAARGVTLVITLGTGIGTALFVDHVLVPNTEFGHIEIDGRDAEEIASARVRKEKSLGWKKWVRGVDRYLQRMCQDQSLDRIIIGGGVSKKHEKFLPLLTVSAEVLPARLRNEAGIIGAALYAAEARAARLGDRGRTRPPRRARRRYPS
ncbi:MAG: ROK family protein [Planctomycetes bacterium]|nr:ROK family protein [Planctomycetota bacterium]